MTMRSMWNGTLTFGMIVIPVRLGPVAAGNELELHQYHRADGGRVAMKRTCSLDGEEIGYGDTARGYEAPNGQVVLLEDSDIALAFGNKTKEARVVMFTDAGQLPRTAHQSTYMIEPDKGGAGAYALLAEALKRTGKVAVVSFAVRERESMGTVFTDGNGYLFLERLNWAADVRAPDFIAPPVTDENQVDIAENLISLSTGEFDWASYKDASAAALADVIRAKIETGQVTGVPSRAGASLAPADLGEALAASVEAAKAARAVVPASRRRPSRAKGARAAA